jgi:hypothetical protein
VLQAFVTVPQVAAPQVGAAAIVSVSVVVIAASPVFWPLPFTELPHMVSVIVPGESGAVKSAEKWMSPSWAAGLGVEWVISVDVPLEMVRVSSMSDPPVASKPLPLLIRRFQPARSPLVLVTVAWIVVPVAAVKQS